MPLLLRKIRKNRWYKPDVAAGAPASPMPADPVGDLYTSGNDLSVFQIENDRSNLERVVTALGANAETISNVDYALFEDRLVTQVKLEINETPGGTPDEEVNKWHRDIAVGTADNLLALAKGIYSVCETERVSEKEIHSWVAQGLERGELSRSNLNPKLRI